MWAGFTTAGFTCWCPEPITVRPAPAGSLGGGFPFDGPVTFVTADNPAGAAASEVDNRRRRTELAAWLAGSGLVWHPAVGGEPGAGHDEPGALVLGLDLATAAALGARFEQAAVYVWEPSALHLLSCAGDRHDLLGYRATSGAGGRPSPSRVSPLLVPRRPQSGRTRRG